MKYTALILWQTFRNYRKHLLVLAVFGFLAAIIEGIGVNVAVPLISSFMGGAATGPASIITNAVNWLFTFFHIPFTFRYLLGFIMALFFLRAVSLVAFGYIRGWITADFFNNETKEMLRRTLRASWPFLLRQKMGHVHNTLVRDIRRSADLLEALSQAIQSWTGFIMYLLVAINISPLMTFAAVIGGGALFFFIRPFLRGTHKASEGMIMTEKSISQFLNEHLMGMKTLKAAGVEERSYLSAQKLIERFRTLFVRMSLSRAVSSSLFQPFSLIFVIILFILTYTTSGFNLVTFAAELYIIQKIFTYLESGQGALHQLGELAPYATSVAEFKRVLEKNRETRDVARKPFKFIDEIVFENVFLSYTASEPVLQNINLFIKRGQILAIVGPSGAGKTSVADLLLRLFEPTAGHITVDGVPASDIRISDWRDHVGYVSQDVFLLNDTIENNIRFYRDDITKEEIKDAADRANIHEFIESLPEGYNTITGDRGVMLSGGQRQRIVLARALAQKPSVLVLDEATSALDHESEKLIQKAIQALRGEVTVLMIAHRPSTVADADKIVVLEKGKVVESGSAQELLADQSSYFYKMQRSG